MDFRNKKLIRAISAMICGFMLLSVVIPAQRALAEGMGTDFRRAEAGMLGAAKAAAITAPAAAQTGYLGYAAEVAAEAMSIAVLTEGNAAGRASKMSGEIALLGKTAAAAYTAGSMAAGFMSPELIETETFDKVIAKVNDSVNIREEATTESVVVGRLYKGSYAEIEERGGEWTKVNSGDVVGYIKNEYLYFDEEAIEKAHELNAFQAEVTAGTVNVRTAPDLDSEIITEANKGDTFAHLPDLTTEDWTAVKLEDGTTAYLSAQFVEESFELETAVSKEEEEARKAAEAAARAFEEAKKYTPAATNRAAIELSDEDMFLMSVVVMMEAGYESYEGQLAVANVLVNRLQSGLWGDTIQDVVYAPNQFSGANSGRIERFAPKVTESCKKAVVEALAGNNNIGSYMSFIMKSRANYSAYSEYYILGNHCFYKR